VIKYYIKSVTLELTYSKKS